VLTVRRLTDEELSIIRPKHAAIAFLVLEILLIGSTWDMYALNSTKSPALMIFNMANAVMLMLLAFGLTPTAELLRGRLSRGRRDEHWKIFFELRNRLEDSPTIMYVALFSLIYAALSAALAVKFQILAFPVFASIAMVMGMAVATASLILYINVYTERGGLKVGALIVTLALTIPPMIVAPLVAKENVFAINPFAYMAAVGDKPDLMNVFGMMEISPYACPALCTLLALLLSALAAMRIRFLLDLDEMQRQREVVEVDKNKDKKVSAARAMLQKSAAAEQSVELKPDGK
jgi:hypothetical protein